MRNQYTKQTSPDHRRVVQDYFEYHNYQEFIPFSEFVNTVVPSLAQFRPTDLPQNFEEQLRADVTYYGGKVFSNIEKILKTGKWSQSSIARLTPNPTYDRLFDPWFEYWLGNDLKKLETAYRDLCFNALDCHFMTVRLLNNTLKDIACINSALTNNGVNIAAWHQRIESNHHSYSVQLIPDVLTQIFANTPNANSKMFSGLKNHGTMTKAAATLPPVLAGTLEAFNNILGWSVEPSPLPVCDVSGAQIKTFCKKYTQIDYDKFNATIGSHYKNLQQRSQLLNATQPNNSPSTLKRKI